MIIVWLIYKGGDVKMIVQKKIGHGGCSNQVVNKNLQLKYILKIRLCQIDDIINNFKKELKDRC